MDTAEEAVSTADLVIEMVPEDLGIKRGVAAMVEANAKPTTILATSTMRLNIDAITQSLQRPENVLGMRFLYPVLLLNFVEVTRATGTCDDAWGSVVGWLMSKQKAPFPGPTQRCISDNEVSILQSRAASLKLQQAITETGGFGGEG
jgi:3-hydroxyacyl-CoA dehydrogenase